jgi:hypothetical protein
MSYCGDGLVAGHSGDTVENLTLLCSRVYTPRLLRHSGRSSDEIAKVTGVPKGPKKRTPYEARKARLESAMPPGNRDCSRIAEPHQTGLSSG